jgi:hypothetical protein
MTGRYILSTTILEQRKIEAHILGLVYDRMKSEFGAEVAGNILRDTIRNAAIAHGQSLAAQQDGQTSLQGFIDLQHLWSAGGALEVEVDIEEADRFEFRVTRCKYAEAYKVMGLAEIGGTLSCDRDGTMCEGYDSKLKLTRTQTIMEGASHCDFKFRYGNED